MRCLALATGLREAGFNCHFICRAGSIQSAIRDRGFPVHELPAPDASLPEDRGTDAQNAWLGTDWRTDAEQTAVVLAALQPSLLLVDHYALDERWEAYVRPYVRHVLVIDDLADRRHDCSLLLDQNLGRKDCDYAGLLPAHCHVLTGPRYALLRPEFAALRAASLARRKVPGLQQLLISLGAVDKDNVTCSVLSALRSCALPADCHITIVLGAYAPGLPRVREVAAALPWQTEVKVEVADMATLMSASDLAIGAAGSTAWERCCLGLPALMVVLADNQWPGATALAMAQAAWLVGQPQDIADRLPALIDSLAQPAALAGMSARASTLCDGLGVDRVIAGIRRIDV